MENKNRIENFEEEIRFKIRNQTFTNEIDLDQYIEWNALAGIIFGNCRFEELDLTTRIKQKFVRKSRVFYQIQKMMFILT